MKDQMLAALGAAGGSLWALAQFKTARKDGELVKIPKYRRMMLYIMPQRNESVVYFDRYIRAEKLEAYLDAARDQFGANMTHAVVGALNIGLAENPKMNQFVVGRRLYRRNHRAVTFSMKRKKLNKKAKLSAVKLFMKDGETFRELVERINGEIVHERSGVKTHADKEFDMLDLLPRPLLKAGNGLIRLLDYYNVLPYDAFIKHDGMYTSAFVANLGSVGMQPGYHHLYEHGTCPLFLMIGKAKVAALPQLAPIAETDSMPLASAKT